MSNSTHRGEGVHGRTIAEEHLSSIDKKGISISAFYGDGAFDQSSMFEKLHSFKARPVIKIRKNKDLGYRRCAELNDYGMRWHGTEGMFSAVKRKFGENTVSRSEDGPSAEGYQRFWSYDEIKEYWEKHLSDTTKM